MEKSERRDKKTTQNILGFNPQILGLLLHHTIKF